MDGVFVAYHNTARMFGFQYISLDEMDHRLFGGSGSGERVFRKCVEILEVVSDEITRCFPGQVCFLLSFFLCAYCLSTFTNTPLKPFDS